MREFGTWMSAVGLWLAIGLGAANAQPTPPRVTARNDLSTQAREPFQVFDNLYFVGQGEVASYVITTDEGHILIDTMWDLPGYLEYLLNNIRKVGLRPRDIRYVLIMQGHRDHFRGSVALKGSENRVRFVCRVRRKNKAEESLQRTGSSSRRISASMRHHEISSSRKATRSRSAILRSSSRSRLGTRQERHR